MPPRRSSTLWRTIRVDWRLLGADRMLLIATMAFAVLLGYAVVRSSHWVQVREQQRQAVLTDNARDLAVARQQLVEIAAGRLAADSHPYAGWVFTVRRPAALPTGPAAALSIGQADLHPFSASIDLYSIKNALFKNYETESPASLLAGRLDPAFVLVYVFPLVLCASLYNLLAQEREQGTLGLILAQPVRLHVILVGKAVARVSILLLLTIAVTLVGLAATGGIRSWREAAPALVLWVVLTASYAMCWTALAVRVNVSPRSSTHNAVVLFAIWIGWIVILPAILTLALAWVAPVPSRLATIQAARHLENQAAQLGRNALVEYTADRTELLPPAARNWDDIQSRFIYTQTAQERRILPVVHAYQARLDAQQRAVDRLRFLSPAVLYLESLNAVAGTDRERVRDFSRQVEAFVDEWRRFAVPRSFRQQHLTPADYDRLPAFRYIEPPRQRAYIHAATAAIALLAATGALSWSAARAIRIYHVTS